MIRRVSRRAFSRNLAALAGYFGIACCALEIHAQRPASSQRIGVLLVAPPTNSLLPQQFKLGLLEAGYAEGRNVTIEWQYANGDMARVADLVANLVEQKVDVIVVETTPGALAAKRATSSIPIVMSIVSDPVGSGLVASLANPGGNITGLSAMATDLAAKRLQLFKEAIPHLTRVAVFWSPSIQFHTKVVEDLKASAPSLSIQLNVIDVSRPDDLDEAFSAVSRGRAQALYVIDSAFLAVHRKRIVESATRSRLPVFGDRAFVDAGAVISYGPNFGDMYRRAGGYVARILKGARPADLPIEQPTKFELVVNLKNAQVLGIAIPESILLRADEVIR